MASRRSQIPGLGTLHLLPPEVRFKIYEYYFTERRVVPHCKQRGQHKDVWSYLRQYTRDLLLVSRFIHAEARMIEMKPGFEIELIKGKCPTPPRSLKPLVTRFYILDLSHAAGILDLHDYTTLREIRIRWSILSSNIIGDWGFPAYFHDIFYEQMKPVLISRVKREWDRLLQDPNQSVSLDWRKVPRGVTVLPYLPIYNGGTPEKFTGFVS